MKIISAGAGSGKTYRLTQEMVGYLQSGTVRASGIIATTFTNKAAAELQERVRVKLLEEGLTDAADELANALIGTVHGLGVKLLKRFAFEAGVSPEVAIMADEDQQLLFNQSLATVLTEKRIRQMEGLADRLGLNKKDRYDWRKEVKTLTDVARVNDFDIAVLEKSKIESFESFQIYFGNKPSITTAKLTTDLAQELENTITTLENNEDSTKTTATAVSGLKAIRNELRFRGELHWHQWVKLAKTKVGAKSRDDIFNLVECAWKHEKSNKFHQDIQEFIYGIFDISIEALREYDAYKKKRGLIDYIDMEIQVKRLLDHPEVKEILAEELDLLMVDEFQDTSPIQLEIFYKLSQVANQSVWVGDPKQSIYGFRGADPKLMLAIIEKQGGVKPEDIQKYSWRSREDIVNATNAIFCKAFNDLPEDQVALVPKRTKKASNDSQNQQDEPFEVEDALIHWHFQLDSDKKRHPSKWLENAIANRTKQQLETGIYFIPKGEQEARRAVAGDVAILCRSNIACEQMAEAFHRVGLKAAISRTGLLQTAEAKLILACLKYLLNEVDSLSVAEILLLASAKNIEAIIQDRLNYLKKIEENKYLKWADDDPFIQRLNALRLEAVELSSSEILNLLLEELELRRTIASWGNTAQRFDNVDVLRKMALQYEENCNRLHTAASLGGFLLWLNEQESRSMDKQGSGEGADAINILTYHKSKGLEYPVVILHNLEGNLRDNIWGISLVSEQKEVDLTNILGNRWIRYWINPYGDQSRGTPLMERINLSDEKKQAIKQAMEEEARLLYVGITRARDYLIFPTRAKSTKWLNRVWHKGEENHPTLDANSPETPWEWKETYLETQLDTPYYGIDFPATDFPEEQITYIEEQIGKTNFDTYHISAEEDPIHQHFKLHRIHPTKTYAPPIKVKEDTNLYELAKALKAFLTADSLKYTNENRLQMANGLIHRFELEDQVKAQAFLQVGNNWLNEIKSNFSAQQVLRKYPVSLQREQRLFQTIIDILIIEKESIHLIQNSGFSGEQKKWKGKIRELLPWLELAKQAIQTQFPNKKIKTYVHFVMGCGWMQVETSEQDKTVV